MVTIEQAIENERKEILNKVKKWFEFPENPKGKKFECDYSDIEELLEQLESQQTKFLKDLSNSECSDGEVRMGNKTADICLETELKGQADEKSEVKPNLSPDISLEQLKKEKEECDKEVRDLYYVGKKCIFNDKDTSQWKAPNYEILKATSLALSKGIEVAEKQKKMFEEFKEGVFELSEKGIDSDGCVVPILWFQEELKKLAEQLEVKE